MEGTGELDGRVALVTGASRGIGRAVAVSLARKGARVALNYHTYEEGARETARIIQEMAGETLVVQADVGSAAQVEAMFQAVH